MKNLILLNEDGEELEVIHSTFPAGEVYVRIANVMKVTPCMTIGLYDASSESIMRCIMLNDACQQAGATFMILETTYMPYSRQDRVCKPGESDSYFMFSGILGDLFDITRTIDLHNPKAFTVPKIENSMPDYTGDMLSAITGKNDKIYIENVLVIAPDKGAISRAQYFADKFDLPCSYLDKVRTDSGITQHVAEPQVVAEVHTIILVDDICDGGRTFIEAAKEIQKINPNVDLYLIISHGIFSAGISDLMEYFVDVFVQDNQYNRNRLEML